MNLNVESWKEFRLGDLFEIKKGKRLTSEDQTEGTTPYIGAIDSNNGVANKIGQDPIHSGNTISLSYNGSVGEAFYQPVPFWATDDVNVLYFKETNGVAFNLYIALFICSVLKAEKYRFSYGRKWTLENMNNTIIKLPQTQEGFPDWDYIEQYIKSLKHKPLTTTNNDRCELRTLGVETWKEYKISELFDIYTGGDLILSETDEGEYPVASNSSDNNNIAFYSCFIPQRKLFDHTYSISIADRGAFKAFVQPKDFYIGTRAKGLESKNKDISILSLLFIATVINQQSFRFSYGYNCCAHLNDMIIKLPAKTDNSLDYSFMENYMKSLPYGDRI